MSASESVAAVPLVISCISVDDEPLALGMVCAFIEQTPFLRLVGRHESAVAALRALHAQPDVQLLFLDIKMPDLSGLELARVLHQGAARYFHHGLQPVCAGGLSRRCARLPAQAIQLRRVPACRPQSPRLF